MAQGGPTGHVLLLGKSELHPHLGLEAVEIVSRAHVGVIRFVGALTTGNLDPRRVNRGCAAGFPALSSPWSSRSMNPGNASKTAARGA